MADLVPQSQPRAPGRLLKMRDVVHETSLHRATIYRRIARGEFPAPIPIGGGRVAWRQTDVDLWKLNPINTAH